MPDTTPNPQHSTPTISTRADAIMANPRLVTEVVRRAALICPEMLREVLSEFGIVVPPHP